MHAPQIQKLLYNVFTEKKNTISSSSNKFRAKLSFSCNMHVKRMRGYCASRNSIGVMCTVSSHHCRPQNIFFNHENDKQTLNQQRNNLTKQNIKIISFDRQHLKCFVNNLSVIHKCYFLVILLNKDVSHCFDVFVSIICPGESFVSTCVGVIGVSSSTKPDSGVTCYAIIFVVSKDTNSRCSEGECGITVAPFGVESLLVTVRL